MSIVNHKYELPNSVEIIENINRKLDPNRDEVFFVDYDPNDTSGNSLDMKSQEKTQFTWLDYSVVVPVYTDKEEYDMLSDDEDVQPFTEEELKEVLSNLNVLDLND